MAEQGADPARRGVHIGRDVREVEMKAGARGQAARLLPDGGLGRRAAREPGADLREELGQRYPAPKYSYPQIYYSFAQNRGPGRKSIFFFCARKKKYTKIH